MWRLIAWLQGKSLLLKVYFKHSISKLTGYQASFFLFLTANRAPNGGSHLCEASWVNSARGTGME